MNTTTVFPTTHRIHVAGVSALVAALVSLGAPAAGIPDDRSFETSANGVTAVVEQQPGIRPCFLHRAHWNDALDASQPQC